MRPIRLPEPPGGGMGTPEIFTGGAATAVRRAVVIGNGSPGAEGQCLGLVRALGLADHLTLYRVTRPQGGINEWLHFLPISLHKLIDQVLRQFFRNTRFELVIQGRKPYRVPNGGSVGLSSVLEADTKKIVAVARDTFDKEGPTLIVACGWDTISYSSSIRHLASDNVYVIQMQHPRSRLDRFDLVVTPRHDYYALTAGGQQEVPRLFRRWITPQEPPGRNVVLTVGALHQADSAALRLAAIAWHDKLAPLPKPLLIINIGGPTNSCGSVRVSFSRRTPRKVSDIISKEFTGHPKIYIWDGEDPNPHMGHLAWADAFVVSADSISMLSEACSTGKPVYVIGTEHCKWKISAFHKTLRERGLVRPFTGLEDVSNSWSYPPLNDAIEVATRVREVIAERGWSVG
ncbi:hypothetical protein GUJ93_ZPchr0006g43050 [Zizania palustris]|uniref:Mitochondrial fission protein ELM1 n=1 Tax=Zizania palustris TaxID=103762 RepID=A0A8J5SK74_ZIZPA|nr:hypothetical protein GUJ93_ZPchr0006g43050 [Zizania palustris]